MTGLTIDKERKLWLAIHGSIREANTLLGSQDQDKGGCFRLFLFREPWRGHIDLVEVYMRPWVGGYTNLASKDKYYTYTFEKAIRLAQQFALQGHVSAAQSADPKTELWDGASVAQCYIHDLGGSVFLMPSVSGWPAKVDAAIGLRTLQRMTDWQLDPASIAAVVAAGQNDFAAKLLAM